MWLTWALALLGSWVTIWHAGMGTMQLCTALLCAFRLSMPVQGRASAALHSRKVPAWTGRLVSLQAGRQGVVCPNTHRRTCVLQVA